jgi:hypothetical protein
MKNIIAFCFALFTFSFAFGNSNQYHYTTEMGDCFAKKETLPAGTLVLLETSESLDASRLTIGQLIQFKVKADVRIDGEVVISTGAMATGRVKRLKNGSFNTPGSIFIEVTSVQSIDGQQVSLNGTEQELKGYYPGEAAKVNLGTAISATVTNDTTICTK